MREKIGEGFIEARVDNRRVGQDVANVERGVQGQFGRMGRNLHQRAVQFGRSMAIPVAALGIAAVREFRKMASESREFEAEMNRIVGLVGVARHQVEAWGDDFARLGPKVRATQGDLAQTMFFITSAGLRGQDAMDALEASAMAAAAGLGDMRSVADAATSAMNAYGVETLSAERATDILVATVREGKMAPEELASALGRVIPIAADLGITFDQLGAAVAVMTRTGLSATESATALRGIMMTLIKPTDQAQEALGSVGLSMAHLRDVAAGPEGLIGVLRLLEDRFGDNVEAMGEIVPNARAITGVMNILGQDAATVTGVFDSLANSLGDAAKAFDESEKTIEAGWERFRATLSSARRQTGDDMGGISRALSHGLTEGLIGLGQLDDFVRNQFNRTLSDLTFGLRGTKVPVQELRAEKERLRRVFDDASKAAALWRDITSGAYRDVGGSADEAAGQIDSVTQALDEQNAAIAALSDPWLNLNRQMQNLEKAQSDYNTAVEEYGAASAEARQAALDVTEAGFGVLGAMNDLEGGMSRGETSALQMKAAIEILAEAFGWSEEQAQAAFEAIGEVKTAADDLDGTSSEVHVIAHTDEATSRVERFSQLLNQIPAEVQVNMRAQVGTQIREPTGRRAHGGPVWPGSWLVGEEGPELLNLGAGGHGHVTPLGSVGPDFPAVNLAGIGTSNLDMSHDNRRSVSIGEIHNHYRDPLLPSESTRDALRRVDALYR